MCDEIAVSARARKLGILIESLALNDFGSQASTFQDLVLAFIVATLLAFGGFGENLFYVDHLWFFTLDQKGNFCCVNRCHRKNDDGGDNDSGSEAGDDFPFVLCHNLPVIAEVGGVPAHFDMTPIGQWVRRLKRNDPLL